MVTHGAGRVRADTSGDTRWTRLLRGLSRSSDD
jgi:phosphatidylinositol alpha-mannosyltransferase